MQYLSSIAILTTTRDQSTHLALVQRPIIDPSLTSNCIADIQPLQELCLEVLTVNGYELRLFISTRTINVAHMTQKQQAQFLTSLAITWFGSSIEPSRPIPSIDIQGRASDTRLTTAKHQTHNLPILYSQLSHSYSNWRPKELGPAERVIHQKLTDGHILYVGKLNFKIMLNQPVVRCWLGYQMRKFDLRFNE